MGEVMRARRAVIVGALVAGVLVALSGPALVAQGTRAVFPTIQGRTLEQREMEIPSELGGERNIVLVAFGPRQQRAVDSWAAAMRTIRSQALDVEVYEIPTLNRGWTPLRGWIDGGMRSGIPDRAAREATITVYIDKRPFKSALGITSESQIQVFLLDRSGVVMHRVEGPATPQGIQGLRRALGLPIGAP